MQRADFLPGFALAVAIALTVAIMWPVWPAAPYIAPSESVRWLPAAYDYRPHVPRAGERISTLRAPDILGMDHAREYQHFFAFDQAQAAVMLPVTPRRSRIYINAYEIPSSPVRAKGRALLAEIPNLGLQAGRNSVQIVTADAKPYEWPRIVFFGPKATLARAAQRLDDVRIYGSRLVSLLGSIAAMLGFAMAFVTAQRRYLALPSAFALLLALGPQVTLSPAAGLSLFVHTWLSLLCMAASGLLLFVILVSEGPRWTRAAIAAFRAGSAALAGVAIAPLAALADPETALGLSHGCAVFLSGFGGCVALWAAIRSQTLRSTWPDGLRALTALAGLSLVAAVLALSEFPGAFVSMLSGPLFVSAASVGLLVWLGWIGMRLFLDLEAITQTRLGLNRLVLEQRAKLNDQQRALEREIAQRAVFEERSRLSREIHDGVGGSLVSLLAQIRSGTTAKEDLEQSLTQALSDLRLMIDAVDHADGPLPAAFSTFYTRISPVLKASGLTLHWQQDPLEARRLREPSHLLNVFRILQEAVTNVIRHANASQIAIAVRWMPEAHALRLDVHDNGAETAREASTGYGLRNMAKRAASIGAAFSAGPDPGDGGWRVRLDVPCT